LVTVVFLCGSHCGSGLNHASASSSLQLWLLDFSDASLLQVEAKELETLAILRIEAFMPERGDRMRYV